MVRFSRGAIYVGVNDYVKCPFCKRVKKDGKILYSRVTIDEVTVLPKREDSGSPHLAVPLTIPLDMGAIINCGDEMDRTAYDGPGIAISCSCELGHEWVLNICMHEGRAIQFVEQVHVDEPELDEAGIAEEDEDEDEES
jgi:hypothetical protein